MGYQSKWLLHCSGSRMAKFSSGDPAGSGFDQVQAVSQTTNTLTPIGMAVAIAGKYMRYGDLVQSDSLAQLRSWVQPPMPCTCQQVHMIKRTEVISTDAHHSCLYLLRCVRV